MSFDARFFPFVTSFDARFFPRFRHTPFHRILADRGTLVTSFDARFFPRFRNTPFHRILADVPCSGTDRAAAP
ncbi:hypothetical protein T484DRAFT_1847882 [Baffinella frigidus]|nr:hypothetical protein T484DRAFT_1847882 [Cryptophyta sp. CCMP2293]